MATVTQIGGKDVIDRFGVASAATAYHLAMIHGESRNPRGSRVTSLAGVAGTDMVD